MLLTLWMTSKIADSAKQKEVRRAMQLVALELRNNLQTVHDYATIYTNEKRIALHLQESEFNTSLLPPDTVIHYTQRLFSGLAKPYRFSTDALEMLKTSGLPSHIGDKQQIIDLLHCYTSLATFDYTMELYFTMRKEVLVAYDDANPQSASLTDQEDFNRQFCRMMADSKIQNWLCIVPRSFDSWFFERTEKEFEEMIDKLEKAYGN